MANDTTGARRYLSKALEAARETQDSIKVSAFLSSDSNSNVGFQHRHLLVIVPPPFQDIFLFFGSHLTESPAPRSEDEITGQG
jgi:hypothetical protein